MSFVESVASDVVFRISNIFRGKWSTFEQCMNSIPIYSIPGVTLLLAFQTIFALFDYFDRYN